MTVVCPHCGCSVRRRPRPRTCINCKRPIALDVPAADEPAIAAAAALAQEFQQPAPAPSRRKWMPRRHAEPYPRSDEDLTKVALPALPTTPPTLARRQNGGFLAQLRRLLSGTATEPEPVGATRRPVSIADGRGFNLSVVGESHCQMPLRRVSNGRRERGEEVVFRAWLVPDAGNPYDVNAVAVLLDDGKRIGHLAREWAEEYRAPLDELYREGLAPHCRAKLIGGCGTKASFGAVLDIRDPKDGLVAPF